MKGAGLLNIVKSWTHWDYFDKSGPLAGWSFCFCMTSGWAQGSFAQAPNMMWNIIKAYVDKGKLNIFAVAALAQIILFVKKKKCWDLFIFKFKKNLRKMKKQKTFKLVPKDA